MKHSFALIVFGLLSPALLFAQGNPQTLQDFIKNFVAFLNGTIVPFMLGIAFLIFVINVVRFFVIHSDSEDGQKGAKALALYSVFAFVFIIVFWGVVNVLTYSFGLTTGGPPTADYENPDQQPGITPPPRDVRTRATTEQGADTSSADFTPPDTAGGSVSSFGDGRDAQQQGQLCPLGSSWNGAEGSCQAI